jgi:hypothetical protein
VSDKITITAAGTGNFRAHVRRDKLHGSQERNFGFLRKIKIEIARRAIFVYFSQRREHNRSILRRALKNFLSLSFRCNFTADMMRSLAAAAE